VVRSPWSTSDDAPSPIRSLPTENPKGIGNFPERVPQLRLKGICPRGNNKVVIIIFHVYDKCLFLMLELY
jgi:hypothetical protein